MFTAHSVAVSATRAVYRAASRETRRTKTPSSPPSVKYPHKYSAHSTRSATLRNVWRSDSSSDTLVIRKVPKFMLYQTIVHARMC